MHLIWFFPSGFGSFLVSGCLYFYSVMDTLKGQLARSLKAEPYLHKTGYFLQ